jgi:hypothetical protein
MATVEFFNQITAKHPTNPGEPSRCDAANFVDREHPDNAHGFCGLCRGFNACAEAVRPKVDNGTIAGYAKAIQAREYAGTNEFNTGDLQENDNNPSTASSTPPIYTSGS